MDLTHLEVGRHASFEDRVLKSKLKTILELSLHLN